MDGLACVAHMSGLCGSKPILSFLCQRREMQQVAPHRKAAKKVSEILLVGGDTFRIAASGGTTMRMPPRCNRAMNGFVRLLIALLQLEQRQDEGD